MSKRFSMFRSAEPLQKKSGNTFVPWTKESLIPSDVTNGSTEVGIKYLKDLLPFNEKKLPKIVMKHQLYSVMASRTTVDRGVNQLQENGDIKLFKTSLGTDQLCIMFTTDYVDYVKAICDVDHASIAEDVLKVLLRFLNKVVPDLKNICVDENILLTVNGFKDVDITELIKIGVLTVKDAGTWWLAIPDAGNFLKTLRKGRQMVLQMLRRTKYREINYKTLISRKPPSSLKLDLEYHVHDLVGADLVKCIDSTTGLLLRLIDD